MTGEISTRDIAVKAEANIESHIEDCVAVRRRMEKLLDGIDTKLDDQDRKLARQTWILGLIMGGLITVSKIIEVLPEILTLGGHK